MRNGGPPFENPPASAFHSGRRFRLLRHTPFAGVQRDVCCFLPKEHPLKTIALAVPFMIVASALADAGVTESTGQFQWGSASVMTAVSAIGAPENARLDGYSFGDIDVTAGQSLLLSNWQFTNFATGQDFLDAFTYARLVVTLKSGGSMISQNTYDLARTGTSGSSVSWALVASAQGTNLAASLAAGDYSVEFSNTYNFTRMIGLSFSNQIANTAVSTATFSVVPAPGVAALLGLVRLGASRRRK